MGILGKLLKTAAPMAANYFLPGSGALVSGVMGGMGQKKSAKKTFEDVNAMGRVNQTNAQGDTSTWSQDPKSGQWTQRQAYGGDRQKASDSFNRIAAARMADAEGMDMKNAGVDWNSLGFGDMMKNVGAIKEGDTGKYPWQSSKTTSLGGDALRYLQFAENPNLPVQQTWGSQPMGAPGSQTQIPQGAPAPSGPPPSPPQGPPPAAPQGAPGGGMLAGMLKSGAGMPPPPPPEGGGGGMIGNMMGHVPPGVDPMAEAKKAMMAEELRKRTMDQAAPPTGY